MVVSQSEQGPQERPDSGHELDRSGGLSAEQARELLQSLGEQVRAASGGSGRG